MTDPAPESVVAQPGFLAEYGEAWSLRDPARLFAIISDDMRYEDPGTGIVTKSREELAGFVRHMFQFSNDSRVDFTSLIVQGNRFVAEWLWSGTATGSLQLDGRVIPGEGRHYFIPGVAICTIDPASGLVASHLDRYDMHELLRQLGDQGAGPS